MTRENKEKRIAKRLLPVLSAVVLVPVAALCYSALKNISARVAGDFFYPYLMSVKMPVRYLSDKTLFFCSRTELAARVEHLTKINTKLAVQAASAIELMRENEELRRQMKFRPRSRWRYVNAQVLLRDPLRWQEHMTIDKGSKDGIYPGCAVVVTGAGSTPVLAGVVSSCSRHSSVVNTVFNPLVKISGAVGSKAVGFVNGSDRHGSGMSVPIDYLTGNVQCVPGEAVMTTGFEHRIPAGIKIGELLSISTRNQVIADNSFVSGMVRVSFDPNLLRFVTVAVPDDPDLGEKSK